MFVGLGFKISVFDVNILVFVGLSFKISIVDVNILVFVGLGLRNFFQHFFIIATLPVQKIAKTGNLTSH